MVSPDNSLTARRTAFGGDVFFFFLLIIFFTYRFFDALTSKALFAPYQDNVYIHAPLFSALSRLVRSGQDPLWVPSFFSGLPIYNSPYFSITYPFYFFHLFNYGDLSHSLHVLTLVTLFHLFIFAANVYVLCRVAGANAAGSFVGASLSLIATNTIVYANWVTVIAPYSWMPLFMAGCIGLIRRPGSVGAIALTTVGASLLTLAGPSQAVIHAILWGGVVILCAIVWLFRTKPGIIPILVRSLIWIAISTFGLAAVAIIPMFLATGTMERWVGRGAAIIGYQPIPWRSFTEAQLKGKEIVGVIWPITTHAIVASPYVGPITLVGVVLAVMAWRKKQAMTSFVVPVAAVLAIYFLWASFGSNLGLAYIHYHIPLLNKIREPSRYLVLFVIMSCLLAAIGYSHLSSLSRSILDNKRGRLAAACVVIFVLVCLLGPKSSGTTTRKIVGAEVGMLVIVVGAIGVGMTKTKGALTTLTVIGLLPLNHSIATMGAVPPSRSALLAATKVPLRVLGILAATETDLDQFRVDYEGTKLPPAWWAMDGVFFNLRSVRGFLQPVPVDRVVIQSTIGQPVVRSLFATKYIVSGPGAKKPLPGEKICLRVGPYSVIENDEAIPRVSFVSKIAGEIARPEAIFDQIAVAPDVKAQTWLLSKDYPVVSAELPAATVKVLESPPPTVELRQKDINHLTVIRSSTRPEILRLNEIFSPDWHMKIGHRNLTTFPVDGYLEGTVVPAGNNTIMITFEPVLFEWLRWLQRLTLAVLFLLAVYPFLRRAATRSRATAAA
jgi:hypothetical protein